VKRKMVKKKVESKTKKNINQNRERRLLEKI